jgi:NADH:ubiquinone oxidoreductase subunit E
LAPVLRVDKDIYATLEQSKIKRVLNRYRKKRPAGKDATDG